MYPPSRSMTAELNTGLTDGKYKQVVKDRGGIVESQTYKSRSDLYDTWYGIHEEPLKITADNRVVRTPYSVQTPPAR